MFEKLLIFKKIVKFFDFDVDLRGKLEVDEVFKALKILKKLRNKELG